MSSETPPNLRRDLAFLAFFAAAKLLLRLPVLTQYGMHGDEYYFLACGERLAAGFADHPPLVPALARFVREVAGESLFALRLLPCLAGTATVILAGLVTRELGGRRFAQALAALAVIAGPYFLRSGNMLSIPSFEAFYWTTASWILIRILKGGDPRMWLAFGAVSGVALLNKHTMLLYGFGVVAGLVLTPHRRHFIARWIWLGGAVSLLVFLPNLVWQATHDWATAAFMQQLSDARLSQISRGEFLAGQLIYAGVGTAPVWITGLVSLLRSRNGPGRVLGVTALVVVGLFLITQGKAYYSLPVYVVLFAAGAVAWERWITAAPRRALARPALMGLIVLSGLLTLPIALPIVPLDRVDGLVRKMTGGALANSFEVTGDLHHMVGWREQAEDMARVYADLPPEDREACVIWASVYSHASSLEFYGPELGLPPVISNHLSYHFWSKDYLTANATAPRNGDVLLTIGLSQEYLERFFEDVRPVAVVEGHPLANPWNRNLTIFLCRRPKRPFHELWPARLRL